MTTNKFDEDEKLWTSEYSPLIFDPRLSLAYPILWTLEKNPNKIIQINHDTKIKITNEHMRQLTIRAAMNLGNLGYEQGDIFGIVAKNSHHVAPIAFASICMGCPINPLDPSFSKTELMHMFSITKPKAVFCDVEIYDLVQDCLHELENDGKIFTFNGQTTDSIPVETLFEESSGEDSFTPVNLDGENTTAAIICTSGSTGLPKGVCLSHAILLHQVAYGPTLEDDVVLLYSTLYWITGVMYLLGSAIRGFSRVITTERFNAELMLNMIEEHRVTYLMTAAHALALALNCERFYESDLSSIRLIVCAGSKLSTNIAMKISEHLGEESFVINAYGMSEIAGCATISLPSKEEDPSVGPLSFGIESKITDEDGNRLGVGELGEICLKTKFKFLGYYENEEATSNTMDDENFLVTGDIGYYDQEQRLHIVDRKKDMMKYCGSQMSPTEIEQYIIKDPRVKAVCVVSVPDEVAGDLPAAVIVQNDNDDPISKEEIEQMVADHFADYKRLRGGVYFMQTLPLTPSGKVLRRVVREMVTKMYEESIAEPDS